LGIYKKACATKLHTECKQTCTLSAQPTCTDSCTTSCKSQCDAGVNITCQHNCFGECKGTCAADCAGKADVARCTASCEATCDGDDREQRRLWLGLGVALDEGSRIGWRMLRIDDERSGQRRRVRRARTSALASSPAADGGVIPRGAFLRW